MPVEATMDENAPAGPEEQQAERNRSRYSKRVWVGCCLAPTLALALVLIIAIGASLYGPVTRRPATQRPTTNTTSAARKTAFIQFGKQFFATASEADEASEAAFRALQAKIRSNGTLEAVRATFARAAEANGQAAAQYRAMKVPPSLRSQDKLGLALDRIAKSYDTRRRVCLLMVSWNGDVNDEQTVSQYRSQAEEVNRLTREGLTYLSQAAQDNQLTDDDVRKFLPAMAAQSMMLDRSPW